VSEDIWEILISWKVKEEERRMVEKERRKRCEE
jgi:hypothetical protein